MHIVNSDAIYDVKSWEKLQPRRTFYPVDDRLCINCNFRIGKNIFRRSRRSLRIGFYKRKSLPLAAVFPSCSHFQHACAPLYWIWLHKRLLAGRSAVPHSKIALHLNMPCSGDSHWLPVYNSIIVFWNGFRNVPIEGLLLPNHKLDRIIFSFFIRK